MRSYGDIPGHFSHHAGKFYILTRCAPFLLTAFAMLAGASTIFPVKAVERVEVAPGEPRGKLVDIGTHRLHIYCTGNGSPTVVLDAGLGSSSLEWWTLQQALAKRARVCAYDRAGYGWSDPGPRPRNMLRIATELHALLTRADIQPPYVLVGHSFGGYSVQLFASLYPDRVAGLVLLDSSHSGQVERFEAQPIGVSTAPRAGSQVVMSRPPVPDNLPTDVATAVAALMSTDKALRAIADELQHFRSSAQQVASAESWPNVPVVVVTRGQRVWPDDQRGQLMESLWLQLQKELAVRNPRSLHIVARNSKHHIHLDQPKVVARAVELVLDEHYGAALRHAEASPQRERITAHLAAHSFGNATVLSRAETAAY